MDNLFQKKRPELPRDDFIRVKAALRPSCLMVVRSDTSVKKGIHSFLSWVDRAFVT